MSSLENWRKVMKLSSLDCITRLILSYALVALVGMGCGTDSSEDGSSYGSDASTNGDWDSFVKEFIESFFVSHPPFAVTAGRHEFDGKLPDWSPEGIDKEIARLHAQKDRANSFKDEGLNKSQGFEREYLLAVINRHLFWLETAEWPFKNPQFYFDWILDSLDPNVYIAREYAPLERRLRAYIDYARALPRAAEQIRSNLRSPLPRTYINVGIASFGGLATYFENDMPQAFAAVTASELKKEFVEANTQAAKAMKELAEWLESQRETATENFALGAELFSEMLRATELVDIPLDELEAIGRADLERNLASLRKACQEYAPGDSIEACVAKVAADKPTGGAVAGAHAQLEGLKAFVSRENLVSIPGTEEALVQEAPPYNRSNFAYIDIPGPYEKGLPSVYYIAPPDPSWPEEEQLAYIRGKAQLLFTSVHEVWPGHFLNFLHSNRSQSKFAQVFVGYAFAEGWAHYTEEMMWEAGYGDGDPSIHIGQLLTALLRNVRFISAIGLHTKGMTVAESERLFREKAFQDPGNARQQAARGTYDPAYLNYTMGKLMIRKLRAEWTAPRGGRKAWREFHDTFLSFGAPPIALVRNAMLVDDSGRLF